MNTQFRADIFIKGPREVATSELRSRWLSELFVLTTERHSLPSELVVGTGEVSIENLPASKIADVLRIDGHRPKTVLEISELMPDVPLHEIIDALVLLVETSHVSPARMPNDQTVERCRSFNRHILRRALVSPEIEVLASPVTAGRLQVPHLSLLFLCAWESGKRTRDELAVFASSALITIFGLPSDDGRTQEMTAQMDRIPALAETFLTISLPALQALVVI